jgi:hypothetical protein
MAGEQKPLSPLQSLPFDVVGRMFTGHITGTPAMGTAPLEAVVVRANNASPSPSAIVTINGFSPTATFTCHYEPRFHWDGVSANIKASPPPAGTPCLVAFPPNSGQGIGWVLAFTGWPLE